MWLAHYGFHLLTGVLTVIPVTQSAALDLFGWAALGAPQWQLTGMRPGLVFPIEVGVILMGAGGSLVLVYLISERDHLEEASNSDDPWAAVTIAITVAALSDHVAADGYASSRFPWMTRARAHSIVLLR